MNVVATRKLLLFFVVSLFIVLAFRSPSSIENKLNKAGIRLVDAAIDSRVAALYYNLKLLSGKGVLFGHQDALAYGVNWREEKGRSDVRDVCGSHPAVFGWELSKLGRSTVNIDSVNFDRMKKWMKEAYKMGGINTISWHMENFVTGGNSWDKTPSVREILPGGSLHDQYKAELDVFADFVHDLKVGFLFKHHIPLIFRPFHEHTGAWFWWGSEQCTPEEYKTLWRFTVEYLRDEKGLHNLLYAYSTDVFRDEAHYLERYPGDEYVDILGFDDYHDVSVRGDVEELTRRLHIVANLAQRKGKLAALTETGQEAVPTPNWWTDVLLHGITADSTAATISYVMLWRNARSSHHYAPYKGHPCEPNFLEFYRDSYTLFENDLPELYKFPK